MNFPFLLFSVNFLEVRKEGMSGVCKKSQLTIEVRTEALAIKRQTENPKSMDTTEEHLLLRRPCVHADRLKVKWRTLSL